MMSPEFLVLDLLIGSWEVWIFVLAIMTYICFLVAGKKRHSRVAGQVGGWILVGLFFTIFGMGVDRNFSFWIWSFEASEIHPDDFQEGRATFILRMWLRVGLLLYAFIWGWNYLREPLKDSESSQ